MPIEIDEQQARFTKPHGKLTPGFSIRFQTVPALYRAFNHAVQTNAAETEVAAWVASGFSPDLCFALLHAIIVVFGGGCRIWGRQKGWYLSNRDCVARALRAAYQHAQEDDIPAALGSLREIKGLGQVSYGSKMLRFFTAKCPVLDDRIRSDCQYTVGQYVDFAQHCCTVASLCGGGTSAVMVEASLYAAIQINYDRQRDRAWLQLRDVFPRLFVGGRCHFEI
jgi:hypothetical protein